jgi:hypothetical protein
MWKYILSDLLFHEKLHATYAIIMAQQTDYDVVRACA